MSSIALGGRDAEERMHRFVTVIGGAAPDPPMGPTSDPNCVVLDVAFLAFHRRRRRVFMCDNQRLVRRFP